MTPDLVVARDGDDADVALLRDGVEVERRRVALEDLPAAIATHSDARIVWADSQALYPRLLAAGVRVRSGVDLLLQRRILRNAAAIAHTAYAEGADSAWDDLAAAALPDETAAITLFDVATPAPTLDECLTEHGAQQAALKQAKDQGQLALLCHAESTGGLLAQELNHTGVPFDTTTHHAALVELLGTPHPLGDRPSRMAELVVEIRRLLNAPQLNPDSAPTLVTALRRAGITVESTRKWELRQHDHPVIAPLLEYKSLARLHTANGWAWAHEWVRNGRFRPQWVAGGVVTGRWASNGGGALQLPRQVRAAVRADPGWKLVVADASQLEPRVLAAMSRDAAMARAGAAGDLYQGLVDSGVVDTRAHAKVAMLGAMYGATTGEAGALMPRLRKAYPQAMALVDDAAATGEQGGRVSTWLGRTCPAPSPRWQAAQAAALQPGAGEGAKRRALQVARDHGRFTRNFVVQGTAAEWALCWLGHLRRSLDDTWGTRDARPEIVYFLHDEVMVHTPADLADDVVAHVEAAAVSAGTLLFGATPVAFPLQAAVADSYDRAK